MTVRLTDHQRFILEFSWMHRPQVTGERFDVVESMRTLRSLERKGLVRDVTPNGRLSTAQFTEEGARLAEELGSTRQMLDDAEKIVNESSPAKVIERRWRETLNLKKHEVHVTIPENGDGHVYISLRIAFRNEAVSETFRLDLATMLTKYTRGGRRFGE